MVKLFKKQFDLAGLDRFSPVITELKSSDISVQEHNVLTFVYSRFVYYSLQRFLIVQMQVYCRCRVNGKSSCVG